MQPILDEIGGQAAALRRLADDYCQPEARKALARLPREAFSRITGMGASLNAAEIVARQFQDQGLTINACPASDLIFHPAYLQGAPALLYISQSGNSGEVRQTLEKLSGAQACYAITNDPESYLAAHSQTTLNLLAGDETAIASKTFTNTIALLWLAVRAVFDLWDGRERETLLAAAGEIEAIATQLNTWRPLWETSLPAGSARLLLGHGISAVTARHAAMMLAEWAKLPCLHYPIGAFRHGYIEIVESGMGAVIFLGDGAEAVSALSLAKELEGYGARVLCISAGLPVAAATRPNLPALLRDQPALLAMLDAQPVQWMTAYLAETRGVTPGFRHITKVVTRI